MLSKRVWRLLIAFGLVNAGEWSFITALSIYAYERAGALGVGLIGIRFLVAAAVGAAIAPVLETRRGLINAATLSRTVLLALGAATAALGAPLAVLVSIVLVDAAAGAFYRPAQQRLIPSLVRQPHELMRAVAGASVAKTVGQALGGTCGGLVVGLSTPGTTMGGGATMMLLATVLVWGPGTARVSPLIAGASSVREAMRDLPAAFSDPLIWPLVAAGVVRTFVRGAWASMIVIVALKLLHSGDTGVGLFQAAAGVGTLLAISVTATQVGRPRLAPVCASAFALSGTMVCLVGLVPVDSVALGAICAWGLAMAASDSTSMALLHRALDPRGLFQTVGAMDTLKLISEGAGMLLAPGLVAVFGMRTALVICGLPMPVLVVLAAGRLRATDQRASDRGQLVRLLHRVTLFAGLDLASIEDLASRLRPLRTAAGEDLVTQGEPGDRFYVIESGRATVLVDGYPIGHLDPGRWLGERALLRSSTRSATVRAQEPLLTQTLGQEDFLQAVTGLRLAGDAAPDPLLNDGVEKMPIEELLGMLTPLSTVDGAGLERLARHAQRQSFEAGVPVFAEGDESDAMYVVLAGRAVAAAADGSRTEALHPGDVFGEIGILHATARTRTVTAAGPLTVLRIPADELLRATGRVPGGRRHPHMDLLGGPEADTP